MEVSFALVGCLRIPIRRIAKHGFQMIGHGAQLRRRLAPLRVGHEYEFRFRLVIDLHFLQQTVTNGGTGDECRQERQTEARYRRIAHHVAVVDRKAELCPNDDVPDRGLESPIGDPAVRIENALMLLEILQRARRTETREVIGRGRQHPCGWAPASRRSGVTLI